jgi:hydrophobic/amphiphilic exporter-1 (mainly G- bacteria), HAE1 family
MFITSTSIKQPVFATMMMVALLVLGVFSYQRLRIEQMPDVANPVVVIQLAYPGASPEAIENDVIKPIESVVNTINGVREIRAVAWEGSAQVVAELRLDAEVITAIQEVRDKVALVRDRFPREVKDPVISRTMTDDNQEPVVEIVVTSSTRSLREVSDIVQKTVVKRLQNAAGVGAVMVNGAVQREMQIQLLPAQMESYAVGLDQVINAIQSANQDLPAGGISQGATEHLVRVEGRMRDRTEFDTIIVAQRAGAPVYLHQLARVIDGQAEETSLYRLSGQRAVGIQVMKIQDANLVEVGGAITKAVADLKKQLPKDLELQVLYSSADFIKGSVDNVKSTIIEGALLTILIVFLFLQSWRSTIITGLTLPIAVIATFAVTYALGFTLNFLTLMALSLCIGLLIDDAIVVRENIVRHIAMGKSPMQAALDGTKEIGLAVTATTFAIVAVFVPVAFMPGIIGRYFFQFGITVTVAVLISLFVSFTLDPMLSSIWHDPVERRFARWPRIANLMEKMENQITRLHEIYDRVLRWALGHRKSVLAIAATTFVGSFLLMPFIGSEFAPQSDRGTIALRINTPPGSSLEYTDQKTQQVEAALKEFPEIRKILATVGTSQGKNYAQLMLLLTDRKTTARRSQKELEKLVRERIARIASVEMTVGFGRPISVTVLGPDPATLKSITDELMVKFATVNGIADLESSEKGTNPTVTVRIKNEIASDLGISTAQIGRALRPLIAGDTVGQWLAQDGENYDVVVRLPREQRQLTSDLGKIYLTSSRVQADGSPLLVPLRQVADFIPAVSPQAVRRQDLQRRASIFANAQGRPAGDVGNDVLAIAKAHPLPEGYRYDIGGDQEEMMEMMNSALAALGMAVIFIYIILASQFGSFLQPLAIMSSLPLSLAGVMIALLVSRSTLNIFSIVGFIMLMGLVTKNAILLVDFTNRAVREGKALHEALLEAGQVRLRPILMTTLAMIFGMLPMAIGFGDSGEMQAPMGRAVIGGVIASTLLTLIVVPVLLIYIQRLKNRFAKRRVVSAEDAQTSKATAIPLPQNMHPLIGKELIL